MSSTLQRNWWLMQHTKRAVPAPIWNLGKALTRRNRKKPEPLTTELRREIASHFREDTLKVQELVGIDLSDWLER